ncbi:alcohol dehydrogenase catalytic domain-containing protein [Streptomyces sp. TX20-6-3]|uniref:zinc-binding dehydrogenase n=1 Tax=Streptomyces sp. TX20-6-3 TaxID=3028705 RepID=UPI0029B4230E|nr:alcohol dehydrogenase catalytic domain-containing protein [Streptomyces sp. TX20-6-3]MDX2565363.1 alcohol dehydrogenase catalytic domain-containing protein [Streptomyces sp. TX20-6-3]
MIAAVLHGTRDVRLEMVPDPILRTASDAIVRVTAACVCGSDLWRYRGIIPNSGPERIGHEFVGIVEEVGSTVENIKVGDFVIASFAISDGTCVHCRNGIPTSCVNGSWWGEKDSHGLSLDAGQSQYVRVPFADGTLMSLGDEVSPHMIPDLLSLCDVLPTGYHAAASARVSPGDTTVVVGDGAVGLCAVLAAAHRGAERIIVMSRNPRRQKIARDFGATDIVAERGPLGVERVLDLISSAGADAVLECVGTAESLEQAIGVVRPGGRVGHVGVPVQDRPLPTWPLFLRNISVSGGLAPVQHYWNLLLPSVLDGSMKPGQIFDLEVPLKEVAAGYHMMDTRAAVKTLLRC